MKAYIKNKVKILMLLHCTKDIYFLCNHYGINILEGDFSVKGIFFVDINNINFIFLKKSLSKQEKGDILIHEFAHFILHHRVSLNNSNH